MNRRKFFSLLPAGLAPFLPTTFYRQNTPVNGTVSVAKYGDIASDIGAAVNRAWQETKNKGVTLIVPAGTWPCLTPVVISTDDRGQSFRLEGEGAPNGSNAWPDFASYQRGSVINATALAGAAIVTDSPAGHRAAVHLRNFAVVGAGITVTNPGIGSHFDNVYVTGSKQDGFLFQNNYGTRFDNLYASKCAYAGLRFEGCNSNSAGTLVSRENHGAFAIEWVQGRANNIENLYLEANQHGAFRWVGDVRSLSIDSVHAEDNNHSGQAAYEFLLGDLTLHASTARACRISGLALNEPHNPFAARVGLVNGQAIMLGIDSSSLETVFAFTEPHGGNGVVTFWNCDLQNTTIDLTHGKKVAMIGCHGTPVTVVIEPANGILEKFGCDF